ncbi:hypothetical protein CRG98_028523 [Punica granatum]|uniref:Uncharacterized protein n=1 Tax=Punica granatum TaxID=22663 RepID=A0A2I0J4E8_PUNGR|nr:hypothetical protein CRG98_028523 [Punica granatum]
MQVALEEDAKGKGRFLAMRWPILGSLWVPWPMMRNWEKARVSIGLIFEARGSNRMSNCRHTRENGFNEPKNGTFRGKMPRVHTRLESRFCLFQASGVKFTQRGPPDMNFLVAKCAPHRDERHFGLILLSHLNLIVSRKDVHEEELRVACCIVHQDVDMGQREVILRTGPIKVSIVDADSEFLVVVFHWHNVCYPFRVIAHLQESCIYLLDDLLFNTEKKISLLTP